MSKLTRMYDRRPYYCKRKRFDYVVEEKQSLAFYCDRATPLFFPVAVMWCLWESCKPRELVYSILIDCFSIFFFAHMDVEQSSQNLEIAESLRARYSDSKLHLVDSRTKYQSQVIEGSDEWRDTRGDRAGPPEVLAADTSAQLVCLLLSYFKELKRTHHHLGILAEAQVPIPGGIC